jgi:hypothetical protein
MNKCNELIQILKMKIKDERDLEYFIERIRRDHDLIEGALRMEDAVMNEDCVFREYEENYAVVNLAPLYKETNSALRRGFQEGWRAYRQYLIHRKAHNGTGKKT